MKRPDRFLLGIVIGIVVLVVVTLVVALRQPAATYQPEDKPEGVAHNYLLALQQEDYARAYRYLSPALPGYPADSEAFAYTVTQYGWQFGFAGNTAVSVTGATMIGEQAIARATITEFYGGGPFGNDYSTTQFTLKLRREGQSWKLWHAERYWMSCWERAAGCN